MSSDADQNVFNWENDTTVSGSQMHPQLSYDKAESDWIKSPSK